MKESQSSGDILGIPGIPQSDDSICAVDRMHNRVFAFKLLQIGTLPRCLRLDRDDRTGPGAVQLLQSLVSHWSLI